MPVLMSYYSTNGITPMSFGAAGCTMAVFGQQRPAVNELGPPAAEDTTVPQSLRIVPDMALSADVAPLERSSARTERPEWDAVVTIGLRAGTRTHPRFVHGVRDAVGRICATREREGQLTVSFGALGATLELARADARAVVDRLIQTLGPMADGVAQAQLLGRPCGSAAPPRHLFLASEGDEPLPG